MNIFSAVEIGCYRLNASSACVGSLLGDVRCAAMGVRGAGALLRGIPTGPSPHPIGQFPFV